MHGHSMVRPGGVLEVGQLVGLVGGLFMSVVEWENEEYENAK